MYSQVHRTQHGKICTVEHRVRKFQTCSHGRLWFSLSFRHEKVDNEMYWVVCNMFGITNKNYVKRLQTTHPISGGTVTAVTNCCANCVEPSRHQQWGNDLPFLGKPVMRTRWMAGTAPHKSS